MADLLDWLDAPSPERGISFAADDGSWSHYSFEDLARGVASMTRILGELERGTVAIVLPTGPAFVAAFFGALAAGDTPCPLAPPGLLDDPAHYRSRLSGILAVARPVAVVVDETTAAAVKEAAGDTTRVVTLPAGDALFEGSSRIAECDRAAIALLQFTSGSTGRPRGARVTWENLRANTAMIADFVGIEPERDLLASWLPLHHDMGLIGALTTATVCGLGIRIMRPDQFVRWPERWLECFGRHGATIGVGPTFGFGFAAKRLRPAALDGFDFSRWRIAIVGADRVEPGVLARFTRLAGPCGFDPAAFAPAYGLAEATLLVSSVHRDELAHAVRPDWSTLRLGEPLELVDEAPLDRLDAFEGPGWLVSCGQRPAGVHVSIVDAEGRPLPEGHAGEIAVRGVTVVDGYEAGESAASSSIHDGTLRTGDAGFLRDGALYVVGRIGDAVKVRGRNVFAEDLEARLRSVPGVPSGRSVIFTGATDRGPTLVALVEGTEVAWSEPARAALADAVGGDVPVVTLLGEPGAILRTSSGKPRRRAMWEAFVRGELAAAVHAPLPDAVFGDLDTAATR